MIDILHMVPSFWFLRFLRSGSFVSVPSFWFLRSGSFVLVPSFLFLRSGSFVPSSHSWIPGFRRLTRGSRVSVVSLVIPYSDPFFRKKIPEKS